MTDKLAGKYPEITSYFILQCARLSCFESDVEILSTFNIFSQTCVIHCLTYLCICVSVVTASYFLSSWGQKVTS